MSAAKKSHKQDKATSGAGDQSKNPANGIGVSGFGDRFREAMQGVKAVDLARGTGIPAQTIDGYKNGAMPSADRALAIADFLSVEFRWLIAGVGSKYGEKRNAIGEFIDVPQYDITKFTEFGKPDPETVSIPASLLRDAARGIDGGIWLAKMPTALRPLAQEGDLLICRDANEAIQDRRFYIFLFDGRPVVRRTLFTPDGLQLRGEDDGDATTIAPHDLEHIRPVARVLSAITVNNV